MAEGDWQIFQLDELNQNFSDKLVEYQEFLRVPTLSCGLYRLKAGSKDMQGPHEDDEVYYVLEGKARLRTEGQEHDIRPGSVLYIRADSTHSFFEIDEDMTLLVFFASAPPLPIDGQ